MNVPEFFVKTWESEMPKFLKVLRAMPEGHLDYTPHERSTKAGDLAWQLVEEQRHLTAVATAGKVEWNMRPRPATVAGIITEWETATAALRDALKGYDEAKSESTVTMTMGGSDWSDTLGAMLWGFLLDMIHHRGQLTTYLRPMGGKVPAIYGPSADDPGQ
jgi:uncharacterized damage-inducible protein DinB